MTPAGLEDLWRGCAPQVLAALVRRYGDFDTAEDALQEALLAAAKQWPADGVPDNPTSWLISVASRRLIDQWRSEQARADREQLRRQADAAGRQRSSRSRWTTRSPCYCCAATRRCPGPRRWP